VSERKKGGGGTTALQDRHQNKQCKNRRRERGGREKERRAVEEPPHSREVIRPRKARRAAEQPRAAFACPLKRLSTSYFTGIGLTAEDLKRYWRSDHSKKICKNVLSRPTIVLVP
jgi:hypothetical protein